MASLETLMEATLASSAAIALVLALRWPLRKAFGARVAYGAWGLVPAAVIAVLLPAATAMPNPVFIAAMPRAFPALVVQPVAGFSGSALLAAAWSAGACAFAAWLCTRQARFRRSLGQLRLRMDGAREAEHGCEGLPATLGFLEPQVIVPRDFDQRFDAAQRELVLAHERAHVQRGDVHANAVVAALRCLFWFNPLPHLAASRFRQDQELACDAHVLATHPQARRRYGDALLQAQLAAQASPLGCHFGFGHPLRERIEMLMEPLPSKRRRVAGGLLVLTLALGGAFAAWAAQPGQAAPDAAQAKRPIEGATLPPPLYPKEAAEHNLSGKVVLLVDVNADGSVANAIVEHSEPKGVFDAQALAAVKKWQFKAGIENGKPVGGRVRVPVVFDGTPAQGKEAAPMEMPAGRETDPAAYDWIKTEPREMLGITQTCDVAKYDPETGVAYCGTFRK
jgi:TonB family protein